MQLLHVDTSILDDQSASRQLSRAIVQRLRDSRDGTTVTTYDLVADPVGHLTAAEFFSFQGVVPDAHDAQQAVTRNAAILNDFLSADVIVIGAPMYNFALPSQLRAWLDRLAVPGRTFRYTANGVEGLAAGKRVVVASTRGGLYGEGTPMAALDHQETYLRGIFGFLGVTDITFVRAEGLAFGPEARTAALAAALAEAQQLAA
ncbi:MAG TPA: FMN-dependent NADH-azoreductase [Stenotrophomonas sp.]|nr:FMN-dependent NADH-azoreductase [Stenotrophomonas sp.]